MPKYCIEDRCRKRPNYNFPGKTSAIYCKTHAKSGMEDIKHKKCQGENCKKIPTFNYVGKTPAIYCKTHAKADMEDIIHKKCQATSCKKRPNYNFPGEITAIYCKKHAKPEMEDVKSKRCQVKGCNKIPNYNFPGKITAIYCKTHLKPDMEDVKNKRCQEENCNKQAAFNYLTETIPIYCKKHAKPDMENIKSKRCQSENCNKIPNYNHTGNKEGIYCKAHAEPEMEDVKSKRCKTDLCNVIVKNKYNGYCFRCFSYMFPDEAIIRNFKTKEVEVRRFVLENFGNFDWSCDKIIDNGCSKRRPDMFLDLGSHVVIVEIDENQHSEYDTTCENKRLMELSQDIAHRPMIMIRFNPDNYTDRDGNNIPSCWKIEKETGKCVITNMRTWLDRLDVLGNEIEKWLEYGYGIDKTVHVVSLFYDES